MAKRRARPVIGLTPDVGETAARAGRPSQPRYELKEAYADAVLASGGLPIVLPYSEDETAAPEAVALCDGVVITGGAFDIPPEQYGARPHKLLGTLKRERTQYEQRLLRAAMDAGLPILGVCGGMQLLAVELGGTLYQDIRDELPSAFDHEQKHDPRDPAHPINITAESQLSAIVGPEPLEVNSTHHQAVRDPGRALVGAVSPDGVIEAIELREGFTLGVQWHPELIATDRHLAIYRALVRAAREFAPARPIPAASSRATPGPVSRTGGVKIGEVIRRLEPLWYGRSPLIGLEILERIESRYRCRLPADYRYFLQFFCNGGEGHLPRGYLSLLTLEEIEETQDTHRLAELLPGVLLFGQEGESGFAFDLKRGSGGEYPVVRFPLASPDPKSLEAAGESFADFLSSRLGNQVADPA